MPFGAEGMMASGAITAVMISYAVDSAVAGLILGSLAGVLMALLAGVLHIRYRVHATLAGMAINLLGLAMASLMLKLVWSADGYSPSVAAFSSIAATPRLAWIANIPLIGTLLAGQTFYIFACIIIIIISWIFVYKSKFGLRLRMVGENPVAANSVGINTVKYKHLGVMICGLLSGLAGTFLSLGSMNRFVLDMTAGRGFVALVINNVGASNPLWSALSALFYGFFDSTQVALQGSAIPHQFLMLLPYMFVLVWCLVSTKRSRGPAGIGKFFDS